eukprot:190200_1
MSKQISLYYSPRILPDIASIEDCNDDEKNELKTSNQYMRRFIHSIIRCEDETFTALLPVININGSGSNKWSPILWAIQKERVSYIQRMFDTDQIVDFSKHIDHKTKRTTLHFAAEKGDDNLVTILLNKNKSQQEHLKGSFLLDINAKDREQCTALFRAAKIGDDSIIKLLLQNGADPNVPNRDGVTPLIIASSRGHDVAVNELLSDTRTDMNTQSLRGQTALMCACAEDRIEIAKTLLQMEDINLNAVDKENYSWNCLMWCVYRRNEKMLALLLDDDSKNKIDYFHENYHHETVLDMLCRMKLTKKLEDRVRDKFHSIVFAEIVKADLIRDLKIPFAVVS